MTRSMSGFLAGLLVGIILVAAMIPGRPFDWSGDVDPTPRGAQPSPAGLPEQPDSHPGAPTGSERVSRLTSPSPAIGMRPAQAEEPRTALSLRGIATWYAYRPGEAAAGPALRRALGKDWRGRSVVVRYGATGTSS